MPPKGTVLATPGDSANLGARRGENRCIHIGKGLTAAPLFTAHALTTLLATLLAGCVIPAPVSEPPAALPASLKIIDGLVDPDVLTAVTIDRSEAISDLFDLTGAIERQNDDKELIFFWYYDYDAASDGLPPQIWQVCGSSPTCRLQVCKRFGKEYDDHRLRVVVSNAALKANAVKPWEFPAGTAYDSIEWRIQLEGDCLDDRGGG